MAISKLICRMLPGIDRPALATVLPNSKGITVMIDVGANDDCKPLHLLHLRSWVMFYAKYMFGIEEPRIGLLSIGEEASKGNILTKKFLSRSVRAN
jgi:glycerol-3-phosphate acyltransferase PlsX